MTQTTHVAATTGEQGSRRHIAVTVMLERRQLLRRQWQMPVWRVSGVLVGAHLANSFTPGHRVRDVADHAVGSTGEPDQEPDREHGADSGEEFAWAGLSVTLYKDACERYWHALIGDQPRVYVVCRDTSGGAGTTLEPVRVSIDYDEAIAFGETDQQVLSAPIPGELYRQMEAFVLAHYQPKAFHKRKRRDWDAAADSKDSRGSRGRGRS